MCAACGVAGHVPAADLPAEPVPLSAPEAPRRFAALRNRDCRPYLVGSGLAMMADNVEHVITYWVLWQQFHSEALVGFQVISHWVPFLLFAVWFGGLADRYDCRRVIQAGQALFMFVSVAWGVLFLTHSLHIWHACVLLVLHGIAGALWGPAEQLMLHDFVGPAELPSAVRLNATFKSLGILFGPVVGSALLLGLGPTWGIFANVAIYLPLTLFLTRTRFTGHLRDGAVTRARMTIADAWRTLQGVAADHTLVSMIVLAGLGSFFVGASLQSAMPIFAADLAGGSGNSAYGVLLFATGAGGVLGGLVLEATGWIRPRVSAAVAATAVYGLAILGFALTHSYVLALGLLFVQGVANLASMSISQTVVQLRAPAEQRGQVVGVYTMSASGLRAGSGLTVGIFGTVVGIHTSLSLSAIALCVGTVLAALYAARSARGRLARAAGAA
ncbi:MFS transporter [uncultured Friedmanniella sp.]|uniref:MFS transporter n=1 Tax=uncultured Friedmanniella sp. TaxID=335381 RepID=UPI0035CC9B41